MYTAQNGALSKDFVSSDVSLVSDTNQTLLCTSKPLIPVILCHGLSGSRTSQSGSCRDLASHGYIVFSLDHHDGSAYYSQKEDGQELFWSLDQDLLDIDLRKKQLNIREREVKNLIDDLQNPDFLQNVLNFPSGAKMDFSKLILGGHSFGGLTAI